MLYNECVEELKTLVNMGRDKHKIERFNNVVSNFNKLGFNISTKFIRNLLNSSNLNSRQKTYKIRNLIYRSKYSIKKIVREWRGWYGVSWNTEVKNYFYKKDFVLTEYDRVNQFNSSRIDEIKRNLNTQRVRNSFIGLK
ncbi:hypothetical protein LCGC14_2624770, partial [marine sediment metagenome]